MGLHYGVVVDNRTVVMVSDKLGRRRDEIISIIDLAHRIDAQGGFRRCTWRQGTEKDLSARFALRRVVPAYDGAHGIEKREAVWLLIEWRDDEDEPANCFLCSLPGRLTKKQLVRRVMQRWRIERTYQDLKDELDLDHYEGRRFPGWHHHVSVVLCCHVFVIAERVRHSPALGQKAAGTRRAATRGLSVTSLTASPPCGSRSCGPSHVGCLAALPATHPVALVPIAL